MGSELVVVNHRSTDVKSGGDVPVKKAIGLTNIIRGGNESPHNQSLKLTGRANATIERFYLRRSFPG